MFAWVPYLGADFGSLIGGFVSAYLVKRGLSVLDGPQGGDVHLSRP